MKTLELKLKKYVLIADAENGFNHFKIYDDEIGFIFIENGIPRKELIKGSYKFFCKGSELTEEIASELVDETIMYEKHKVKCYRYRSYKEGFVGFDNAKQSFISAVESKEKFWLENPIEKPKYYELWAKYGDFTQYGKTLTEKCLKWQEAEEKTFRNPLIFVKK